MIKVLLIGWTIAGMVSWQPWWTCRRFARTSKPWNVLGKGILNHRQARGQNLQEEGKLPIELYYHHHVTTTTWRSFKSEALHDKPFFIGVRDLFHPLPCEPAFPVPNDPSIANRNPPACRDAFGWNQNWTSKVTKANSTSHNHNNNNNNNNNKYQYHCHHLTTTWYYYILLLPSICLSVTQKFYSISFDNCVTGKQ